MLGPTPFRDTYLVAGFELREMLRSRRAYLVIVLYLLFAALMAFIFVQILTRAQPLTGAQGPMGQPNPNAAQAQTAAATTGPTTPVGPSQKALFGRRSPFNFLLRNSVQDKDLVEFLVLTPPLSLFYFLTSLSFVPILVMITSSETVAQEHQSRGVRFTALRTGRIEFVVGKVLGQGLLMALVTLLSGGMGMAIAAWKLQDFEFGPALDATLLFWPRIMAYCAPFLGLAALCSMNSSSVVSARVFSLVGLGGLWFFHQMADAYADTSLGDWFNKLDYLTPYSHQHDLWYPTYAQSGGAMAVLVGLGVLFVAIGLVFYRRRDL